MRRSFWVSITLGVIALFLVPIAGVAAPLSDRIAGTREQLDQKESQEGVLTTEISGFDTRIESLSGQISGLLDREEELLGRLEAKRAELERVQGELAVTRDRLARLRDRLAESEAALADRLVEIYKTDEPDAVTVVLEADGFNDLLERTEFLDRISSQDQRVVARVRDLKQQVSAEVDRLAALEQQVEAALQDILERRNELASTRQELTDARADLQGTRDARQASLARVRESRVRLEGDLSSLHREQRRIEAELQAAQQQEQQAAAPAASSGGGAPAAGPVKQGSGQLIWPVNGPITSPFGTRWGRPHEGVDIAVSSGTPVRAADSGRVATAGPTGGYGNYVCVQHGGSLSTCYAHLSRIGVSTGQSVSQGDVIGSSGCTGSCYGDHLHFETREGGQAVDPMGYL